MARPHWMTGREVKDADHPVTINIRQHHINEAVSQDGENCVAARCTLQALDASHVWFYRSKAYIAWDDDEPILRYQNSAPLIRKVIEILDDSERDNSTIEPGLYTLLPPPPGQRLGLNRAARSETPRGPKRDRGHRVMGRMQATR